MTGRHRLATGARFRKIAAALSLFGLLLFVRATPGAAQTAASFQVIPPLNGDTFAIAGAVSADGTVVVGRSLGAQSQAMEWTAANGTVGLGYVSGLTANSYALAASQNGAAIFGGSENSTPTVEAFQWTAANGMTGLSFPAGELTNVATGASYNGGVVVGYRLAASISGVMAFRWTSATGLVDLGILSGDDGSSAYGVSGDGSTVVGASSNSTKGTQQAFRWTQSSGMVGIGYLPGDAISAAYAASSDGSVVVGMSGTTDFSVMHAFRWTASTGMVNLGALLGDSGAIANAVSANGDVVVGQSLGNTAIGRKPNRSPRAMIWTKNAGMQAIQDVLQSDGVIVGDYFQQINGSYYSIGSLTIATGISSNGLTIIGKSCGFIVRQEGASYVDYDCAELPWVATLPPPGPQPGPALTVSPTTGIAASGVEGGPFSPASFSYTLSAPSGSVDYSITGVPPWLTASSTSGTATTSGTTVTFTINSYAGNYLSGTFVTGINFNNSRVPAWDTPRSARLTVNPN
jgi:probable HAF family extracellular repeat protein